MGVCKSGRDSLVVKLIAVTSKRSWSASPFRSVFFRSRAFVCVKSTSRATDFREVGSDVFGHLVLRASLNIATGSVFSCGRKTHCTESVRTNTLCAHRGLCDACGCISNAASPALHLTRSALQRQFSGSESTTQIMKVKTRRPVNTNRRRTHSQSPKKFLGTSLLIDRPRGFPTQYFENSRPEVPVCHG